MSNKSTLQANNETLASILSNVLGLPSQESLKHGAYVWKKCEYTPPVMVENPSITLSHTRGTTIATISDSTFDLTKIDKMFLDGFGGDAYPHIKHDGSTLKLYYSSTEYTSINSIEATTPTTATLNLAGTVTTLTNVVFAYNGAKTLIDEIISEPIAYFVADQETAYPDGGEQDGYWYEKVVEGVDLLSATGFTKIAVDKFTTTSNETIAKQISHSLGVIPRLVIICSKAKDSEFNNTNYIRNVFLVVNPSGYSEGAIDYDSSASYRNITDVPNGNGSYACTASIVCAKPYTTTATYYKAGREYTLITMA